MSSCYKTLEQYNSPCPISFPELGRNCVNSNCPSLKNNSGYYNISNTRGICESAGCSVQTPFIEKFTQMRPAAVRGTWDQVKGLYELNPQGHSCVNLPVRENYNKPTVVVLSADSWCGYSKKMSAQEKEIKAALKAAGFDCEFVNDSKDKAKFDKLAKQHKVNGFPTTVVGDKKIPGFMTPEKLVEKVKKHV